MIDISQILFNILEASKVILTNSPYLLKGILVAVEITVLSMALGLVLGIFIAFTKIYGSKTMKRVVGFYEWIMRGLPILVLLFIIYFGLPTLGIQCDPFLSIVLALGLASSAYQAQIYRGAILSIGSEQMEAGLTLGLNKFQTLFYIILPQAVRLSLPGFTNEFTIVLKDSPLAYAVGIAEILKNGHDIILQTYRPFEIYFACSIIYFCLFQLFYFIFTQIAKRYEVPGYILEV